MKQVKPYVITYTKRWWRDEIEKRDRTDCEVATFEEMQRKIKNIIGREPNEAYDEKGENMGETIWTKSPAESPFRSDEEDWEDCEQANVMLLTDEEAKKIQKDFFSVYLHPDYQDNS